jgi:hypothetical protein
VSQEEWIKQYSRQAPVFPDEVLSRVLAQFGVKIKK